MQNVSVNADPEAFLIVQRRREGPARATLPIVRGLTEHWSQIKRVPAIEHAGGGARRSWGHLESCYRLSPGAIFLAARKSLAGGFPSEGQGCSEGFPRTPRGESGLAP